MSRHDTGGGRERREDRRGDDRRDDKRDDGSAFDRAKGPSKDGDRVDAIRRDMRDRALADKLEKTPVSEGWSWAGKAANFVSRMTVGYDARYTAADNARMHGKGFDDFARALASLMVRQDQSFIPKYRQDDLGDGKTAKKDADPTRTNGPVVVQANNPGAAKVEPVAKAEPTGEPIALKVEGAPATAPTT